MGDAIRLLDFAKQVVRFLDQELPSLKVGELDPRAMPMRKGGNRANRKIKVEGTQE